MVGVVGGGRIPFFGSAEFDRKDFEWLIGSCGDTNLYRERRSDLDIAVARLGGGVNQNAQGNSEGLLQLIFFDEEFV